jgi:dTDP-4-dehydrorhamnose 3,5-epimerase-like enzyme
MKATPLAISDVILLEPKVFGDGRGLLFEIFNQGKCVPVGYYAPEHERRTAWNDPAIGIQWPLDGEPDLSVKDQQGKSLAEAEPFA